MTERPFDAVGLLLAGGSGSRFDPARIAAKLLAPIEGVPVALRAAQSLSMAVTPCLVVIRPEWQDSPALLSLQARLIDTGMVASICDEAAAGMGHSLAWGVREVVRRFAPRRLVVALADMPWVRAETIGRLLDAQACTPPASTEPGMAPVAADRRIIAPRFDGQRGHPVVFGADLFDEMMALRGDRGAGSLLARYPVTLVDVDDAGILRDVDHPQDLA